MYCIYIQTHKFQDAVDSYNVKKKLNQNKKQMTKHNVYLRV